MRIVASLLFGGAAALLTTQAGRLTALRSTKPRSPIAGRRRRSLLGATGVVLGTEAELQRLVTRRVLLVALASGVGVLMVYCTGCRRPGTALAVILVAWQWPVVRSAQANGIKSQRHRRKSLYALGEMAMGVEAGLR